MNKIAILLVLTIFNLNLFGQLTPEKMYGDLFIDVQISKIFPDGKTFVDCIPKKNYSQIVSDYAIEKQKPGFDLKKFVEDNFIIPVAKSIAIEQKNSDIETHIKKLWQLLKREADKPVEGSSLLALPHPYIVPGGRFREIYYWDSYFTMLGLKESGEINTIENMIDNFAYLINHYGHIPNGNRSYYLSRSQPPFFSLMVELLASIKGDSVIKKYLAPLQKEYNYWMQGSENLKMGKSYKRLVRMNNGLMLNRYWDDDEIPRQESYAADVETADKGVSFFISNKRFASQEKMDKAVNEYKKTLYRNLRSGAFSGWDFSSRWMADKKNLYTTQTNNIIPVDLNCLMYNLERLLSKAYRLSGDAYNAQLMHSKAADRESAIQFYCYNKDVKFYCDYDFVNNKILDNITPAGMFPFCFFKAGTKVAENKMDDAEEVVKKVLLKPGGIVTSIENIGQQWDAPNGWAPLQWMTIWAFERNGKTKLAKEIALRWIALNKKVFDKTGKLMEKYNVENLDLDAGGGEYPGQDGFGWTNGVLLALIKKYEK